MGNKENEIIIIQNVSRTYLSFNKKIKALSKISLNVKYGESVLISGESGSGKTTLLKIIGLLDKPSQGNVIIKNANILKMGERHKAEFRRENIGFIFQKYHLFPYLSSLENVSLPLLLQGKTKTEALNKAKNLLVDVGLSQKIHENVSVLSGGEAQRVAIARALSLSPDIILADEPTGNLDKSTETKILEYLINYQKLNKKTFIIVSHNLELINMVDKHIILSRN